MLDSFQTQYTVRLRRQSLSVFLFVCLPACLPACLSVCLAGCLPACLPACLFVYLAGWLAGCLTGCLPVCLPVCLFGWLSGCLSVLQRCLVVDRDSSLTAVAVCRLGHVQTLRRCSLLHARVCGEPSFHCNYRATHTDKSSEKTGGWYMLAQSLILPPPSPLPPGHVCNQVAHKGTSLFFWTYSR